MDEGRRKPMPFVRFLVVFIIISGFLFGGYFIVTNIIPRALSTAFQNGQEIPFIPDDVQADLKQAGSEMRTQLKKINVSPAEVRKIIDSIMLPDLVSAAKSVQTGSGIDTFVETLLSRSGIPAESQARMIAEISSKVSPEELMKMSDMVIKYQDQLNFAFPALKTMLQGIITD